MKEVRGDVFDLMKGDFQVFCVTTNGFIKNNGECVMGAGIAKTVKRLFPILPKKLGTLLKKYGNKVFILHKYEDGSILTFPVKHNWWEDADIELIKTSCKELMRILDKNTHIKKVLLPRPGCGNGKLKWVNVKPIIEPLLDDRVYVANNDEVK